MQLLEKLRGKHEKYDQTEISTLEQLKQVGII